ncbi:uncharacterized protein A4U43_C07F35920 [Asparagus officinalis]|uniref:DUF7734 domain-containing protein n=1 Tax=Asparagus officinalis TaxID=4686 RepID=A0A5P1EL63_ASPOF|nr:uncharacterized protein LOC109849185 [Asparagus officinalis]ONK65321.1 uncharacterized protein A4U43_C07F35920 [Asparagus officinalis]
MLIRTLLPRVQYSRLPLQPQPTVNKSNMTNSAFSSNFSCFRKSVRINSRGVCCSARRRVRYGDDEVEDEEYGHNKEIAMLESYSESAWSKALLVRALVDGEEEEVLIFRGFSSCLSSRTATELSKSVLPQKAIIKSIDVIKGPFDPSNIEYLERDLTWETFKSRLRTNTL